MMKEKIARAIREFLDSHGIDPLYATTIFAIFVFLCHFSNFKKWKDINGSTKRLTIAVTFATAVTSFFCLLKLLGIADL